MKAQTHARSEDNLKNHPGANPHRGQLGQCGQFLGVVTREFRRFPGDRPSTLVGPFDASRYVPHQGAQEIARRQRQAAHLAAKKTFPVRPVGRFGWPTPVDNLNTMYPHEVKIITESMPCAPLAPRAPIAIGGVQDSGNPVGRHVSWTSNGKEKTGQISHVVPAGKFPADVGAKVKDVSSSPRDEESFVVLADGKSYWPRKSVLNFA